MTSHFIDNYVTLVLVTTASHTNKYDWLVENMTGGWLGVDLDSVNDWQLLGANVNAAAAYLHEIP